MNVFIEYFTKKYFFGIWNILSSCKLYFYFETFLIIP